MSVFFLKVYSTRRPEATLSCSLSRSFLLGQRLMGGWACTEKDRMIRLSYTDEEQQKGYAWLHRLLKMRRLQENGRSEVERLAPDQSPKQEG